VRIRLQFLCCGAVGPQDFKQSAWYNRTHTDANGILVPGSCCVDRPTFDAGGKPVVLSAAAKVGNCQQMAKQYIDSVDNPDGPDPNLVDSLYFLQTQVGTKVSKKSYVYFFAGAGCIG